MSATATVRSLDKLKVAPGLRLPVEAATETFAILGKRGSGKTSTAVVVVEEMVGIGQPVVVIDPIGVWWGLRSSADGNTEGLPVVIFGGDHADVPLERGAGTLIANVVIEQRISAVLDLSVLSKTAARTFVADFLEQLYHRNREALHVVVDEADLFAPQRAVHGAERLLGSMEDLVRRGRARGIGVTLITQRPASLHKDVLSQAEVLVTLRMTGPRDVAAIDEWVRLHADEDEARTVKASLPSLAVGEAWFWSPGWLAILQRVQVRPRSTYDSSATPKAGQVRRAPKRMAQVDIDALGEQITATVEKAKADDPRALRARVAELERELAAERAKPAPPAQIERVEVPALSADDRNALSGLTGSMVGLHHSLGDLIGRLEAATQTAHQEGNQGSSPARRSAPRATHPDAVPVARGRQVPPTAEVRPAAAPRETRPSTAAGAGRQLAKAERAILSVLAQHGTRTTTQVALLTAYSHKSGGFRNALSSLRSSGYIDGRGDVTITGDGLTALGDFDPLPTGAELLDWWKQSPRLGKAEKAILDVLFDEPGPLTVDAIAERTGYSSTSGGFRNALSRLRSLELASGRGELELAESLR